MESNNVTDIFSISEEEYGDGYQDKLFGQYKSFLQMVDNLIDRRKGANKYFLSMNTGLLSVLGLLFHLNIASFESNTMWVLGGSVAGILFAYSWYRTLKSYIQLSSIKWKIILEIEKKLPLRLHETEWALLGEGKNWKKYWKLTDVEQTIPIIFIGIYAFLIILVILATL